MIGASNCCSDLWRYAWLEPAGPARMEHEFIDFTTPSRDCTAVS